MKPFNGSERATMLAALSCWMANHPNAHRNENEIPASYRAFFDDCPPLMPTEINDLCEKINFEDQQPLDAMTNCIGITYAVAFFRGNKRTHSPEIEQAMIEEIECAAAALAEIENAEANSAADFWEKQKTDWKTVCESLASIICHLHPGPSRQDYRAIIGQILK